MKIVIPWRGFRCFTLNVEFLGTRLGGTWIVIPWRGFRCFTPKEAPKWQPSAFGKAYCNPLAGI